MSCNVCSSQPELHSYLVHLVDEVTNKAGRTVVQSPCQHDIQQWLSEVALEQGGLMVEDYHENLFSMTKPRVLHVDAEAAAHIPLRDPNPVN